MNSKSRFSLILVTFFAALCFVQPAQATSKEIIEMQTQVQQLLDMVQRLQSTLDTRFGVIQHLVEQSTDTANQMTSAVNGLQTKLNAQSDALSAKLEASSGQVQALNDSVDELKSTVTKLTKNIQEMQSQLQNIQNPPPTAATAAANAGQPGSVSALQPAPPTAASTAAAMAAANAGPPLQETFQAGVRDYNAAHYDLAAGEFADVAHYYPQDPLAGTAEYYIGELNYRQNRYVEAVKAYTIVLEQFEGSSNALTAQLHKGLSLLQLKKREAGVRELRMVIQRHPQSPEAAKARYKLNEIGERITPIATR